MRITGGQARGISLRIPKGDLVRPATDAMRQAVFSSIASRIEGSWVLDLFAGTGAYGLEALSRGAAGAVWVEKNAKAASCIRQNIAAVCKSLARDERDLTVLNLDASAVPDGGGQVPDLVFIDPPYDLIEELAAGLFSRLTALLAPKPDPVIIFEMPGELTLQPLGWTCVKRLGKGVRQPTVCFFKVDRAPPSPA